MNKWTLSYRSLVQMGVLALTLSQGSWADLSNTANSTYKDALNNSYNAASNTAVVTVVLAPSIALTKTANPASVVSGGTVTFTIAYKNNGGNATNVVITDVIPVGSTLVLGSISAGGTLSGSTITWTIGNVAAGATGSVSFQVTAN